MMPNKIQNLGALNWLSTPQPGHMVQFYKSHDELTSQLSEYIGSGLEDDDSCIVIATPEHIKSLGSKLNRMGIHEAAVRRRGQYIVLDAVDTLAKFMVGNMPGRGLFFKEIGGLVHDLSKNNQPIRAYGEMVAVLWKNGNKDAVLMLEHLWNELAEKYRFSLLCAYPQLHFIMDKTMPDEIRKYHNLSLQEQQ